MTRNFEFFCFHDWTKMYAIWRKNELKLKDWNGDLPAARWGLLAQSSSIKGATLRVWTVKGQEITISKIDNRLLWKCIFGTFKKSLVVSLILFLSFFLPISFSLIFSVTLALAYVQFAVSSLALVHGCFNAYSAFFLRVLSFTCTFFSLLFSISTSFSLCLFLTLSVSFYTPLNTYALFLSNL